MKTNKTICESQGHNYAAVKVQDEQKSPNPEQGNLVFTYKLYCTKCGETKDL